MLASQVSSELEEGDFRRAIRVMLFEDSMADRSDKILAAFQQKHQPHPNTSFPIFEEESYHITVSEDVSLAIKSFPCGSAKGTEGLRPTPQDMIDASSGRGGQAFTYYQVRLLNRTSKMCSTV